MHRLYRSFALAVSLLLIARVIEAQTVIGFQPLVGYYWPLGRFDHADLLSTALPQQPSDLRGPAWGVALQLRLRDRFAVEVFGQTTMHTLPGCLCPGGPTDPQPVHVGLAGVLGQYDVSSNPRYHLWAGLGPAVIRHSGRGYERPDSPISWGGAFALELAVPLPSRWEFVTNATGVGYSFNLDFPPQHGPQLDALLSLGARWHP